MKNWSSDENMTMKGYVMYAMKQIKLNYPELKLSNDQAKALLNAINWATDDLTAEEAFEYYIDNE